jgi:hypothetical protein
MGHLDFLQAPAFNKRLLKDKLIANLALLISVGFNCGSRAVQQSRPKLCSSEHGQVIFIAREKEVT